MPMGCLALPHQWQVPTLRNLFKDLLCMDNEVSMHVQALQTVKRTYAPSGSANDFASLLQQKTQQLLQSQV